MPRTAVVAFDAPFHRWFSATVDKSLRQPTNAWSSCRKSFCGSSLKCRMQLFVIRMGRHGGTKSWTSVRLYVWICARVCVCDWVLVDIKAKEDISRNQLLRDWLKKCRSSNLTNNLLAYIQESGRVCSRDYISKFLKKRLQIVQDLIGLCFFGSLLTCVRVIKSYMK